MRMSCSNPMVTVVLPAYNAREHIAQAIHSILAQDYSSLEVIVVDDGSLDDTAELVRQKFPMVRLYEKENGGAASARNFGLRNATGEYIAFLDADDVWLPGKLHAQIRYMESNSDCRLLCGKFSFWLADEDGFFPEPSTLFPEVGVAKVEVGCSGWVYHKLLLSNFVWTSTVIMRHELIEEIGYFDESLRLGQDYDYWLRASRVTEIHRLENIVALYRKHENSATMKGVSMTNHAARVIEMAVSKWGRSGPDGSSVSIRELKYRLYRIYFSAGYGCYRNGRLSRAVQEFTNALKVRPVCLKSWAYLLLSLGGRVAEKLRMRQ